MVESDLNLFLFISLISEPKNLVFLKKLNKIEFESVLIKNTSSPTFFIVNLAKKHCLSEKIETPYN